MAEILRSLKGDVVRTSGLVQPNSVVLTANTTVTPNSHAGRVLVVPTTAGTDQRVYTLDDPQVGGVHYQFQYEGTSASGQDIIIKTETATNSLAGNVIHISTDSGLSLAVRANAGTHDALNLKDAQAFNINVLSNSASTWHVWGSVSSDTPPTFTSS